MDEILAVYAAMVAYWAGVVVGVWHCPPAGPAARRHLRRTFCWPGLILAFLIVEVALALTFPLALIRRTK